PCCPKRRIAVHFFLHILRVLQTNQMAPDHNYLRKIFYSHKRAVACDAIIPYSIRMGNLWNDVKTPFFVVLFIFLGIFIYTKLAGGIPFAVNSLQTVNNNVFQVSATAKKTAVPNTALISLGVTATAPTVTAAQSQVNDIANKLITDLKGLGISEKNIQT